MTVFRLAVFGGCVLALSAALVIACVLYTARPNRQAATPPIAQDAPLEFDSNAASDLNLEVITIESDSDLDLDLDPELLSGRNLSFSSPPELQFSCSVSLTPAEERAADRLQNGLPDEQAKAALALWRAHSRRYADKVLEFVSGQPATSEGFQSLKDEVERSLSSSAIRQEMQAGDYAWGVWLSFLQPHADLVPQLLADLETNLEHRPALILTLGKSKDERAFEPLLELLKTDDYQTPGWAAEGLKYLGDPRAEPHLIEAASAEGNGWKRIHACRALGELGTAAAIPTLESIARDDRYTGALSVQSTAQRALERVRERDSR